MVSPFLRRVPQSTRSQLRSASRRTPLALLPPPAGTEFKFTITKVKEAVVGNAPTDKPEEPKVYNVSVKLGDKPVCTDVKDGTYAIAELNPPALGVVFTPAGNVKVKEQVSVTVVAVNAFGDPKPEPTPEPTPAPTPAPPVQLAPPVVIVNPHFTG